MCLTKKKYKLLVKLNLKSTNYRLLIFSLPVSTRSHYVRDCGTVGETAPDESTATCSLCGSTACHRRHLPLRVSASGPNV
jgi:hypothetical protein